MTARFLALFPELTDVNGDAQNALVLARRAGWAGVDAEVQRLAVGDVAPDRPSAVVLGSTTDPVLPRLLAALQPLRDALAGWLADGVPLLAVGTGVEALGERIALPEGELPGLGVVPGESSPLPARAAGDLVVRAEEGDLVGYENHTRGFLPDRGIAALGTVVRGVGDGAGTDGLRHGSILGTRLHGPVLAKNPALADAFLTRALGGAVRVDAAEAAAADAAAARIRAALLA